MSETTVEQQTDPVADVGDWLRAAREEQGLSASAVAAALHLDTAVIQALEAEAFEQLGATVFAKGHLRAVAGHLGLDLDEATQRFNASAGTGAAAEPELIVNYHRPVRRPNTAVVAGVLGLALALIAILAWVLWPRSQAPASAPTPLATGAATAVAEPDASGRATDSAPENAADVPDTAFADRLATARERAATTGAVAQTSPNEASTQAADTAVQSPQQAAPAPAGDATAGAGVRNDNAAAPALELAFAAECWFEVRAADGSRLAYGTAQPGTVRRLSGERPLAVILGVPDAVTVRVDGAPFEVTPAMRSGRIARFSVP